MAVLAFEKHYELIISSENLKILNVAETLLKPAIPSTLVDIIGFYFVRR